MNKRYFAHVAFVLISFNLTLLGQESKPVEYGVFSFEEELVLPGTPEIIYDAATGDISGWWDHSFTENPLKLYIEPKPGGGFYEIFDETGDGVLHASVIAAHRGKLLRLDGPLGLAGMAIQIVSTYAFEPVETDSTRMTLSIHASGEMQDGLKDIVQRVWKHFLFDRFKPYVESGQHLSRTE